MMGHTAATRTGGVDGDFRGRGFDAMTAAARKKLGVGSAWEWYAWDALDGPGEEVLITGGVPSNPTAKKPSDRWKGVEPQRCVITRADMEAARAVYERETGLCASCNDGEQWSGWSRDHGHRYRPCTRCNATGKAPARSEAES